MQYEFFFFEKKLTFFFTKIFEGPKKSNNKLCYDLVGECDETAGLMCVGKGPKFCS